VCEEKHSTRYWDATTFERFAEACLAILTERWEEGYWYHDPDDDGLGDSEWAEQRRAEIAKAKALTKEQLEALPEDARKSVLTLRREDRVTAEHDRQHREWYQRAKRVVEDQDMGTVTVGRNRFARDEPEAWLLLQERSDAEYERVTLETLESREGSGS
jgi:hypothetical protein